MTFVLPTQTTLLQTIRGFNEQSELHEINGGSWIAVNNIMVDDNDVVSTR